MAINADAYLAQLQALLPEGAAWPRESEATLTALLGALAEEFARFDTRLDQLINESLPTETVELLAEWERMAALPDPCVGAAQTLAERRAALASKLLSTGGQSSAYYVELARALGYEITIEEYPEVFSWQVQAPQTTVRIRRSGQPFGEHYSVFGNAALECVLNRLKPAHTTVSFSYAGGD